VFRSRKAVRNVFFVDSVMRVGVLAPVTPISLIARTMPLPLDITESAFRVYASHDTQAPAQTEQERNELLWLRLVRESPSGAPDPCYGCVDWYLYEQPKAGCEDASSTLS
jgi:hypothetical protein